METTPPSLTTFSLPRLAPGALGTLSEALTERLVYGEPLQACARAQWLGVAEDAGYISVPDLCEAFADVHPQQALQQVSEKAFEQFLLEMNRLAGGRANAIFSGEMSFSDGAFMVQLQVVDVEVALVGTLMNSPLPVAILAYKAMDLVSQGFMPALMPHELVSSWVAENIRGDIQRLRKAGVNLDADIVYDVVDKNPDEFEGLGFLPLEVDFSYILDVFSKDDALPDWMCGLPARKNLMRLVRGLQGELNALSPRHRRHPWAMYAARVLDTLLQKTPASWRARQEVWDAITIEDGHTYIGQGIAVYAGSQVEEYVINVLYSHMNEAGETPGISFPVSCLADTVFRETLSGIATGYRLIMDASLVNETIQHSTQRKSA